jgi:hypothetical protein
VAGADSYVNSSSPGQNFGSQATMQISDIKRSLLKFDVSSIPAGSTVTSAELVLCFSSILSLAVGRTHELNLANSAWTEAGVTWSNQPAAAAGQPVTWSVPLIAGCISVDATVGVQAWVDSGVNNGWLITDQDEPSAGSLSEVQYATREDPATARRPTLNVTYTP